MYIFAIFFASEGLIDMKREDKKVRFYNYIFSNVIITEQYCYILLLVFSN